MNLRHDYKERPHPLGLITQDFFKPVKDEEDDLSEQDVVIIKDNEVINLVEICKKISEKFPDSEFLTR